MLKVCEIYGPVKQGEGKSVGKDVLFLRLSGCNLQCIWCDTPYTWNWIGTKFAHPEKYDRASETQVMSADEILNEITNLSHSTRSLVISGGEPMLQQKQLISLLKILKSNCFWIEVETNGTIVPRVEFAKLVDQFNCSPKLANSTMSQNLRENEEALTALSGNLKTSFKFVVSSVRDIEEILRMVTKYGMEEVYLMPEGRTPDELVAHETVTKNLCSQYGFHFSPRLHIVEFGSMRRR